jgi:chromosome segregation ATPase
MADENKPTDKIDLASTEVKVGGVTLKGSYIVWALAIAGSIAGSIIVVGSEWEKYQRVKGFVAEFKAPDLEPLIQLTEKVKQLDETTVNLSQAIAESQAIGSRLTQDLRSVQTLIEANDVSKLQGAIAQLKTTVDGVQVFTRDVQSLREGMVGLQKDMAVIKKDVDSQWSAIDSIGAGSLKGGK